MLFVFSSVVAASLNVGCVSLALLDDTVGALKAKLAKSLFVFDAPAFLSSVSSIVLIYLE